MTDSNTVAQTQEPTTVADSTSGDFFNAIEEAFRAAEAPPQTTVEPDKTPGKTPGKSSADAPATASADDLPKVDDGTDAAAKTPLDDEPPATEPTDDDADSGLSGKAGRRFKQLKAELKQYATELETLRTQLRERETALEEYKASNTELDRYKQQLAEYEQLVSVTKLEAHPAYKREVEAPMIAVVETAEEIAKRYGIDTDELIDVLGYDDRAKQDSALEALLDGVKERDKLAIYRLAEQVPEIIARKHELLENAKAAMAELEQAEAQRQQEDRAKQLEARKTAAEAVAKKIAEKIPFLAGLENVDLSQLAKRAGESEFDGLDNHNKTYYRIAGDLLPTVAREFVSLRNELEEALDELEELKKVEPKAGAGATGGSAALQARSGSFLDAINAAFGS